MGKHFTIAAVTAMLLQFLLVCNIVVAQTSTTTRLESVSNKADRSSAEKTSAEKTTDLEPALDGAPKLETKKNVSPGASLEQSTSPPVDNEGVPLIVGGEEILRFKTTISGFSPSQRVTAIDQRIAALIKDPKFSPLLIRLTDTGYSTDLVCAGTIILTVTDRDAQLLGFKDRNLLAQDCASKLSHALVEEKAAHSPKVIFFALFQTAISTLVLILFLLLIAGLFPRIYAQVSRLKGHYIKALRIQKAELLSEESLADVVIGFCRVVRGLITLSVILIWIERILSYFPTTRRLSTRIVDTILVPIVATVSTAITSYLPNLLFISMIVVVAYYLITFTNFIFMEIGRGKIAISDFDPEWADPTYKIARFLIVAFSLVLIFPYLPGSGSPAFQQISLFLGVLFSLGSSRAVSNIVAGVFLTYTGAFRLGDRVKIADTVGDVVERKLIYTRVRTIKDEYITIPNSIVLGAHIINYSSSSRRSGLILHTSVTIGYDVPWRKVESLLLEAALATSGVLKEPPPFVLVTQLDNFYITHEINCYTLSPHMMAVIYADLHKQILDRFNESGVEIMSPSIYALRRAGLSTLPPNSDDGQINEPLSNKV